MTLYEIDSKYAELIERGFTSDCVNEDGELDEEKIARYLAELPGERADKLEAYGIYIKQLEGEAEAIAKEEERLAARRLAKEKRMERMKRALVASLDAFGEKKFETARVAINAYQSERVEIDETATLPEAYMQIKKSEKPDKRAIRAALKSGLEVPGARLTIERKVRVS